MGLTPRISKEEVRKDFMRRVQAVESAIIFNLKYLGEACINEARVSGDYTDQTGNLRSSVGYIIVSNGTVVYSGGFGGNYGKGGSEGEPTGRSYAMSKASKYRKGYALIVVAGMEYAAKVEATGRNVLSTAKIYAEKEMAKIMRELKRKIAA